MNEAAGRSERRVSILAVGTELVDGQVDDVNSGWIARACRAAGLKIVVHVCVPDDHGQIRSEIEALRKDADVLFVTGGLGPTSDDFTREMIAEAFALPLDFSQESWNALEAKLKGRGLEARDAQKQQCWFPRGARLLPNSLGTADGFCVQSDGVSLYALPGPPSEVAAVFENIAPELLKMTSPDDRTELFIWRCLGRGESDLAELVEAAVLGSGLTVGYRAHAPYVEVKAWALKREISSKKIYIDAIDRALAPWLVGKNGHEAMDELIGALPSGGLHVIDGASGGCFSERLVERVRALKRWDSFPNISIETRGLAFDREIIGSLKTAGPDVLFSAAAEGASGDGGDRWVVAMRASNSFHQVEIAPPYKYKLTAERGRRYIAEKMILFATQIFKGRS